MRCLVAALAGQPTGERTDQTWPVRADCTLEDAVAVAHRRPSGSPKRIVPARSLCLKSRDRLRRHGCPVLEANRPSLSGRGALVRASPAGGAAAKGPRSAPVDLCDYPAPGEGSLQQRPAARAADAVNERIKRALFTRNLIHGPDIAGSGGAPRLRDESTNAAAPPTAPSQQVGRQTQRRLA